MFLFSDDSTLHTEFSYASNASNASGVPLKVSEQVEPRWNSLLMGFYCGYNFQHPDERQLYCLQVLTGSSKEALRRWFRKMPATNATTKTAVEATIDNIHPHNAGLSLFDIQLNGLLDASQEGELLDPTLQDIDMLPEGLPAPTQPKTHLKVLAPRPLLHAAVISSTSIHGQGNVVEPADLVAPFLFDSTHHIPRVEKQPYATPATMGVRSAAILNFNGTVKPSILAHSSVYDLVQQQLQHRALQCSTGHNIQGLGGHPCSFNCGIRFRDKTTRNRHEYERFPHCFWFCTICGDVDNANSKSLFTRKDKFKEHIKGHGIVDCQQLSIINIQCKIDMDLVNRYCGFCSGKLNASNMLKHVKTHICRGESMSTWRNIQEDSMLTEDDDDDDDDDDDEDDDNNNSSDDEGDDDDPGNSGGSNRRTDNGDNETDFGNPEPDAPRQRPGSSFDDDFNPPDDSLNYDNYSWSYSPNSGHSLSTSTMSKEVHRTRFQSFSDLINHLQVDANHLPPSTQADVEDIAGRVRGSTETAKPLKAAEPTVSHDTPWASHRSATNGLLGIGAQFCERKEDPLGVLCAQGDELDRHHSHLWAESTDGNGGDKEDSNIDAFPFKGHQDLHPYVKPLKDEFCKQLKRCWTKVNYSGRHFVDTTRVKRWLEASPTESLQSRFSILLSAVPSSSSSMGTETQSENILLFSILLSLRCCELLPRFIEAGLNDHALPISESVLLERVIPSSPLERLVLESFQSRQWRWCPAEMKYGEIFTDHGHKVLPFVQKARVSQKGAAGEVYKVQVHAGFFPETSKHSDASKLPFTSTSVRFSAPA